MKASFNVLNEPWIPVLTTQGTEEKLGIRQTLLRAQDLQGICSASPLEEYAVYRFLGLFLMDALRPKRKSNLKILLRRGFFEAEIIETYISECEAEGVSFDLFDEVRPFLQSPRDDALDGPVEPVSVLDCTRPSGNNHTHFYHGDAAGEMLLPEEALRLLLVTLVFTAQGGRGYSSGVNGDPPFFGIIQGENLFETLVSTLLPIDRIGLELDTPPVLWRSTVPITPKREIAELSWMQGMLFPARRIRLAYDTDGMVKGVYYREGEKFVNKKGWKDPYVTYCLVKGALEPLRPKEERAIWRNYCDIIGVQNGTSSQLLALYHDLHVGEAVELTLYGARTRKASFEALYRENLRLPYELISSSRLRVDYLYPAISNAEALAVSLKLSLVSLYTPETEKDKDKKVRLPQFYRNHLQQFYMDCKESFWSLCDNLAKYGPDKSLFVQYCQRLGDCALKTYDDAISGSDLRASALEKGETARDKMCIAIRKMMKEARQ